MTSEQFGSHNRQLLLVCAQLPQINGPTRCQQSWRLLTIARRTHDVHLVALLEDGVQLQQWRQAARRTQRLALIGRGLTSRRKRLLRQIEAWTDREYDAVICDDPTLWPAMDNLPAQIRTCDLRGSRSRAQVIAADRLPPDVMLMRDEPDVERWTDLLQPPRPQQVMPLVMINPHLTLRRAA
ncbi:MAG: hypothetical protein IT445_13100 [Phycisphaeraceae bacterium]|nr:hypothetical protein [Phycisphaeraceae bacterium]